jgi:muconate cycloisomerase
MPDRIASFELFAVDLAFRKPFKHAAAERLTSSSVFLKCVTQSGAVGWGECLPRDYVTGETRDGAFEMLETRILPGLVGFPFESLDAVRGFLEQCDGEAPPDLVPRGTPQTAAWCAVDLALLDAFGHAFDTRVQLGDRDEPTVRYSVVTSADRGFKFLRTLLKIRVFGVKQVKLKVEHDGSVAEARTARRWLGRKCSIRADANMAWTPDEALAAMAKLAELDIRSFEQPIAADDLDGLARLVRESGLGVMVDESLSDRASLATLIEREACTAVNVRISKCGGIVAALNRCREALAAGLTVQVGCQVGESSLLSAAHLALTAAVGDVTFAEGCFGHLLLREDPVEPVLQFGYGGRPPTRPAGPGFGVTVDEERLRASTSKHVVIEG